MRLSIGAGGIRVFGFLPELRRLPAIPDTLGGISMGAVLATLLAVGYSLDDLSQIFLTVNIQRLILDEKLGDLLGELLGNRGYGPETTMGDLPKLSIAVGNLTHHRPQLAPPDMPVLLALRAATAIPVIFPSVVWEGDTLIDAAAYIDSLEELVPGPWHSFLIVDAPTTAELQHFPSFAGQLLGTAGKWRLQRFLAGAQGPTFLLPSSVGTFAIGMSGPEKQALLG